MFKLVVFKPPKSTLWRVAVFFIPFFLKEAESGFYQNEHVSESGSVLTGFDDPTCLESRTSFIWNISCGIKMVQEHVKTHRLPLSQKCLSFNKSL